MQATKETKQQKQIKIPHLLNIILVIIALACVMTYIIPAGVYDRFEDGSYDPDSYHRIDQTPVSPWQTMLLIIPGMQDASSSIMLIMFSGGCMGYIIATDSITKIINFAVYKLQDKGVYVLIPAVMFLMCLLSAFGGNDSFVAFVAVGVIFAKKLRLDPIVAFAAFFLSQYTGFATGPNKIVRNAQLIADVPIYSGFGQRFIFLLILIAITILYTMRYALKIQKDPSKSLMGDNGWLKEIEAEQAELAKQEIKEEKFDLVAVITTISLIMTFVIVAWGAATRGWNSAYTVPWLMINTAFTIVLNRTKLDDFAKMFVKGVNNIAFVCFIIGMARVITYVMERGNIMHTIVYWACIPLSAMGRGGAVIVMFIANCVINFFIPSGNGQAAVVMPLMTPIADVLGITRQVACSAFSLGDGLANLIVPTSGILMGGLEMAKCPYQKWMKFMIPLFFIWCVASSIWLNVMIMIGWS